MQLDINNLISKTKSNFFCQIFKPNYWTILIIFLFTLFTVFDAQLYSWIQDKAEKILSFTYSTIAQYARLNWALYITIIFIGYCLLYRKAKDLYISLNQILILMFALYAVFNSNNYWIYSKTPLYIFTYGHLFITLILLQIAAIYFSIKRRYITASKEKTISQGFAVDTPAENILEEEKPYWSNFCSHLLQTDISKEPFSVGIVGDWGSGKTTVLNTIREELKEKAYIIEFNPWYSHTPQQILTDFFKVMQKSLKGYYSPLSNSLSEYLSVLTDIDIDGRITKVSKLISSKSKKDINTIKEELQKCLNTFEKPIIVFIDDLDRLEASELFEVLRLIRNTAKFSNMIFISAYDRNYLEEMLQSKNVASPSLFIEKIFNLEISLPHKEEYNIPEDIVKQIMRMLPDDNTKSVIWEGIRYCYAKNEHNYIITRCIKTFRATKRFANQFATNISNIQNSTNISNFNIKDFFLLEVIHYSNIKLYNTLKEQPLLFFRNHNNIFYFGGQNKDGTWQNKTPEEFKQILIDNNILIDKDTETYRIILEAMFCNLSPSSTTNICYLENYSNYFSLRVQQHKVTRKDFNSLLNSPNNIEQQVKDLCQFHYGTGKCDSLTFIFKHATISQYSQEHLKSFLDILLYWFHHTNHQHKATVVQETLYQNRFTNQNSTFAANYVTEFLKNQINIIPKEQQYIEYAKLFSQLFNTENRLHYNIESILNNADIIRLAEENANIIINKYPEITINDIFGKDHIVAQVIKSSILEMNPDDEFDELPINILSDYFIKIIQEKSIYQDHFADDLLEFFSISNFVDYDSYNHPHNAEKDAISELHNTINLFFNNIETYKELIGILYTEEEIDEYFSANSL